ncbi:MAG: hypothetical protein JNK78_10685 [Planctomycetes bacterium]|nr:hypothetical protein [Planctomycetota bacterium]
MTLDSDPARTRIDLSVLHSLDADALAAATDAAGLEVPPGAGRGERIAALFAHQIGEDGTGHVEGVLDLLPDGFGFIRQTAADWAPMPCDPFVNQAQVKRLNLRPGHRVAGPVRAPRGAERFFALQHVERVNGADPDARDPRVPFAERTPILPHERLHLRGDGRFDDLALVELLAPWGRGQRVLLATPPSFERASWLVAAAAALRAAQPELLATVCLLDQRPEDAAAARRRGAAAGCTVVATTFDEPTSRHIAVADLALAAAQRDVEAGRHVVLALDSLTSFARACNVEQEPSGRLLCAGLDAVATQRGKRLFGAARTCEEGGSLTVIAAAVASDDRVDRAVLDEFLRRGNSEVVFTANGVLDVVHTATRNEDLLLSREVRDRLRAVRAELTAIPHASPEARHARAVELWRTARA